MRVSEYYNLQRSQGALEFVDVDIENDVPLFVDPGAIRLLQTTMAQECTSLVQSFFQRVLDAMQQGAHERAKGLLSTLSERNETRLGFTTSGARGHGMGTGLAAALHERLSVSRAVQTGLLQDLEETALFVPGIDRDVISDIVTNITFRSLVSFTTSMCQKYDIPIEPGIAFYYWDRRHGWVADSASLPLAADRPLVLVPRAFVRRRRNVFNAQGYYDHYILPWLQEQHLDAHNGLIRILKDGTVRPPTKKSLRGLHPNVKETNTNFTEQNPEILEQYRTDTQQGFVPIGLHDLGETTGGGDPDFDDLLRAVLDCTPGRDDATKYQRAIEQLLTALLYPALDNPKLEQRQHGGRKRIDIDYENQATRGFFHWIHAVHGTHASYVAVECKNYVADPGNPEIDQLLGRFTVQRGSMGILCYRNSSDKELLTQRCRDAALAGQGYVISLDDADLVELVEERKRLIDGQDFVYLHDKFRELIT